MLGIQNLLLWHCVSCGVYSLTIYACIASIYGSSHMALVSAGFQSGLWFASTFSHFGLSWYLDNGGAKAAPRQLCFHRVLIAFLTIWSCWFGAAGFGLVAMLIPTPIAAVCLALISFSRTRSPALLYKAWTIISICATMLFGVLTLSIVGIGLLGNAAWALPWVYVLICESCGCIALEILIYIEFDRWRQNHGEYGESTLRVANTEQSGEELSIQADVNLEVDSNPIENQSMVQPSLCPFMVEGRLSKRSRRCGIWTFCTSIAFALSCYYLLNCVLIPHTSVVHDLPECTSCHCREIEGDVQITDDVLYRITPDGQPLYLTIYNSTWNTRSKSPAVLLIHGGGFKKGDRNGTMDSETPGLQTYSLIRDEAIHFAKHGFIAISIDYRLCPKCFALPPAYVVQNAIQDAKSAVRFIVKNADSWGVDKHRIVGFGDSAGAIILTTMNYALDPSDVEQHVDPNAAYPSNITATVAIAGAFWPLVPHTFLQNQGRVRMTPWYALVIDSDYAVPKILSIFTYSFFLNNGITDKRKWAMQLVTYKFLDWHVTWDPHTRTKYRPSIMRFYLKAMGLDSSHCQHNWLHGTNTSDNPSSERFDSIAG